MKYIPIEKCGDCPHCGMCNDSVPGGPDEDPCYNAASGDTPPSNCPISDLPEWGLLAEGEVIREGDEEVRVQYPWESVAYDDVSREALLVDQHPIRRRLGGGK